ncbi:uncharacterized protein [Engystomops pustulosus]|uniref:uncharacterized protein n=1 Tax=Engystomops pustulosus TaxID=76066 RepID=UPI003AFB04F5
MSYFFTFLRPYAPLKSMGTYKIRVTYVVATVCCRIYVLYLGIPGTRGGEGRTFLGVRSNMAYVQMERLLALVQAHPILWDKRLEDFHNRALKHKKWEEITAILLPDEWASSSTRERASLVKKVSTRWVSARDQYKREKSEKGRSGSGKLHKKPYLYTSFMRFLDPVMDVGETADNLEESASMQTGEDVLEESFEEQAEDLSTPQPPSTPPPPPMRSRRRRQLGVSSLSIAAEREVLDQLRRRRDESAEDICMRSMVQDLQGVHEDDRMNCRVAMMAVLQTSPRWLFFWKDGGSMWVDCYLQAHLHPPDTLPWPLCSMGPTKALQPWLLMAKQHLVHTQESCMNSKYSILYCIYC